MYSKVSALNVIKSFGSSTHKFWLPGSAPDKPKGVGSGVVPKSVRFRFTPKTVDSGGVGSECTLKFRLLYPKVLAPGISCRLYLSPQLDERKMIYLPVWSTGPCRNQALGYLP